MSYLAFAWIASIIYGIEVIISKIISKNSITDPWLFNFVWSLFVTLFTLLFAFGKGSLIPLAWGNVFWASLFYALSGVFYILSMYKLDVTVLAPLFNFRSAISVFIGVLFLNEVLSVWQLSLILIIFLTGVLVTLDEHWNIKSFLRVGVVYSLMDVVCLSLMGLFINKSTAENGYWSTTIIMPVVSQFILLATIPVFYKKFGMLNPRNLLVVFFVALIGTFGTLAANRALSGNISLSTVIISLPVSMILAFLLSRLKPELLENHPLKVYIIRFSAAALMFAAAIKLTQGI